MQSNILEILNENCELVQESNKRFSNIEKFIIVKGLVKSNGVQVRETFIEKIIKENSELRSKVNQHNNKNEGLESDIEEWKRFEKKRERKQREKDTSNFSLMPAESDNNFDDSKYKLLEKRKNELENELLTSKQKWINEKENLESDIIAFKDKIESVASNYQSLQLQLKTEKSM